MSRYEKIFLECFIIIGIIILLFAVKSIINRNEETKEYLETIGYFCDYSVYSSDEDGTTYELTYEYYVDGRRYTASTDYGTGILPKKGSERKIKYDPQKPEKADLGGFNGSYVWLIIGTMFIAIPYIMFRVGSKNNGMYVKEDDGPIKKYSR